MRVMNARSGQWPVVNAEVYSGELFGSENDIGGLVTPLSRTDGD